MSWYDPFGFFDKENMYGTDPSIMTQIQEDPYKTKVSGPLGDFLASQIGKGIGEYETDPNYLNRYNEFMQLNPTEYYNKNVADPAHEQFNKYAVPLISEGYAGGLRGSGHYGAQEAGQVGLQESLARGAAEFIPGFSKTQIDVGQSEFARRYANWYNSLAVTNPALGTAINFLNADSGYNILSGIDQGQSGWFNDLLKALASAGTAAAVAA